MGVDSGLPDFRGRQGFWKAYPPMQNKDIPYTQMETASWFSAKPALAWGFWGHNLKLYREAIPHYGYEVLKKLGESKLDRDGYFVFTSNVDGAFLKAGFDEHRLLERHGSVHYLQCVRPCSQEIWSTDGTVVEFSAETFEASEPLPTCKNCHGIARPNALLFDDFSYNANRRNDQVDNYVGWFNTLKPDSRLVIIEVGAGTAVPTVRKEGEKTVVAVKNGHLIRINPQDTDAPEGSIVLPLGGKDALTRIEDELRKLQQ